jgi:amino acid transporter
MSFANNHDEKGQYAIEGAVTPPSDHGVKHIVETKGAAAGEAADIYGDVQTAEHYGYVERK